MISADRNIFTDIHKNQEKVMNAEIRNKIEKTIQEVVSAYNQRNTELTLSYFHFDENFLGYALDGSKISNREEYRKLLEAEFNSRIPNELHVLRSRVSVYRTMATFSGECDLRSAPLDNLNPPTVNLIAEGNVFSLKRIDIESPFSVPVRITAVLREFDERWKINQLHFSALSLTQAA